MRLTIPKNFKSAVNFGDWTLYHLPLAPEAGSFLWQPFKLMLPPDSPCKRGAVRAYRLTWNPLEGRFAKDTPSSDLARTHPTLHAEVELYLQITFNYDWLTEQALYEPEEIEAEQERLRLRRAARVREARAAGRE